MSAITNMNFVYGLDPTINAIWSDRGRGDLRLPARVANCKQSYYTYATLGIPIPTKPDYLSADGEYFIGVDVEGFKTAVSPPARAIASQQQVKEVAALVTNECMQGNDNPRTETAENFSEYICFDQYEEER